MIENKNNLENVVAPLTIRDHFAMAALTGLIANCWSEGDSNNNLSRSNVSYQIADVMMEEREKKG